MGSSYPECWVCNPIARCIEFPYTLQIPIDVITFLVTGYLRGSHVNGQT